MRDAIVVGGGIAGMSAAWRLRFGDVLVLEGSNRIGGRLRSERRGPYWLNWGGHVFGGEGSFADKLLKEVGVDALNLQGSFAALAYKGKVLNDGNVNFYPFRLPISWPARWEIIRAGLKVMRAVKAYGKVNKPRKGEDYRVRQQRIYDFMADRTFSDFTGPLSEEADAFFRPTRRAIPRKSPPVPGWATSCWCGTRVPASPATSWAARRRCRRPSRTSSETR